MKTKLSGKFIVLDGPDGCGKSTQTELLIKWLKVHEVDAVRFRDPGDTAIGEQIREILLNPAHQVMITQTEVLLYMAARSQLWSENIAPALSSHRTVILDRWLSSTLAYQGWAGGFGIEKIIKIAADCLERVWPDITIILDVNLQTSSQRLNRLLDRMEAKGGQYHEKVRQGFLKLPEKLNNCFVVDASENVDNVHKKIIKMITEMSFV